MKTEGLKIGIIGAGNVGYHLARIFSQEKLNQVFLYARNLQVENPIHKLTDVVLMGQVIGLPEDLDVLFLAINDDALKTLTNQLPATSALVLHTSGSVSMSVFDPDKTIKYGVFYPLQRFRAGHTMNYKSIPVIAEASDPTGSELIEGIAARYFGGATFLVSEQRRRLHLAAVVVNNFTNHLHFLSDSFLKSNKLDFNLLHPLIATAASELSSSEPPFDLQTGPARRNDVQVIEQHLELLEDDPEFRELYRLLSISIRKHHS